jgi:hypothetical protein
VTPHLKINKNPRTKPTSIPRLRVWHPHRVGSGQFFNKTFRISHSHLVEKIWTLRNGLGTIWKNVHFLGRTLYPQVDCAVWWRIAEGGRSRAAPTNDNDEDEGGKEGPWQRWQRLFFPYSLNVEELYNRISGTSRYLGDDNRSDDGWHVTMVADNYPSPQIITSFF